MLDWLKKKLETEEENLSKHQSSKKSMRKAKMPITSNEASKNPKFIRFGMPRIESSFIARNKPLRPIVHRKSFSNLIINRKTLTDHEMPNFSDSLMSHKHKHSLETPSRALSNSTPNLFVS